MKKVPDASLEHFSFFQKFFSGVGGHLFESVPFATYLTGLLAISGQGREAFDDASMP
ncbi:hypothetical protein [Desulfoluna limicola]|uniref:hypothetical protein n=1 Tax=Desulfoluna limicola TaxID=2810562 RepID=UPI001F245285|nr:hypothetical protein [Desulfoluna limicola]